VKRGKPGRLVSVLVTFECCGHEQTTDEVSWHTAGGCFGHGEDCRCYCPSIEGLAVVTCSVCAKNREFSVF
jgi:hypothetical protein